MINFGLFFGMDDRNCFFFKPILCIRFTYVLLAGSVKKRFCKLDDNTTYLTTELV